MKKAEFTWQGSDDHKLHKKDFIAVAGECGDGKYGCFIWQCARDIPTPKLLFFSRYCATMADARLKAEEFIGARIDPNEEA